MIDVEWNDNAKAAAMEFACYIGKAKDCERYFKHIAPKTKTVADAVEWAKAGNEIIEEAGGLNNFLSYRKSKGSFEFVSSGSIAGSDETELWQPICTRAEFEAYVKEQDGGKWTHTLWGDKAYIKIAEPDCDGYLMAVTEGNGYNLVKIEDLKPIKPTITKAEAWDILMQSKFNSAEVNTIKQQYDII